MQTSERDSRGCRSQPIGEFPSFCYVHGELTSPSGNVDVHVGVSRRLSHETTQKSQDLESFVHLIDWLAIRYHTE